MKGAIWMSGSSEEKKTYYRLTPCPAYDVEGMESWLSDLAEEGLFLTSDGFFCGFGFFEKNTPRKVKYRLQASETEGGFFSDNDEPEEEEQEFTKAFGWEYVARRGEFYIYCSENEEARELNTDPEVQALSLKMVQKRRNSAILNCILWGMLYPLGKSHGAIILPMLYMKNWFYAFSVALVLWFFASSVREAIYYAKLRKKLKNGEQPDREKNWKKRAWMYPLKIALRVVTILTWIFIMLGNLGRTVLFEDEIPLQEYEGTLPFATLEEFFPETEYSLERSSFSNTVIEWSDWVAPVNVLWEENGVFLEDENRTRTGFLNIDYHELRWEWMAKLLAADYYRKNQGDDFEFLYEPELGIDYAVVYKDDIFTKVILREVTKVLHGYFYEYHNEQEQYLTVEEWAKTLAESIKK